MARQGRKPAPNSNAPDEARGRIHPNYRAPVGHLPGVDHAEFIVAANPQERASRLKALRRARIARAREYFPAFFEYAFWDELTGAPLQAQWFHDEWSQAMDTSHRLFVAAPRAHGKTTVVVARTIWELGRNPNLRIKIVCASDGKAMERLFEVVQHLSNPRVREVFPDLVPAELGEFSKHKIIVQRTARHRDASLEALGITSTATGGRADLLIADDVVDRRNALEMPAMRTQIKHAWKSDWTNLLEPDVARVWYICTLWSPDDLSHELMENPAYDKLFYAIPDDFGAMWPDRWSEAALRARFDEIKSIEFNRGFRNVAIDIDAGMVKPTWMRYAELAALPAFSERLDELQFITSYDTATATSDAADFSAGTTIAVDVRDRRVYVVDAWHDHITIKAQAARVWDEFCRYSPFRVLIEKAGQSTLDEWVANEHQEMVGFIEVTKPRQGKAVRLLSVTPLLEGGEVVFSHHLDPNRPGFDASRGSLVTELLEFPFGKHDDMCLVSGTQIATMRGSVAIEDVNVGDYVLTPLGPCRVRETGRTGEARVITSHGVTGTPSHPVFVHGLGFRRLDTLTQGIKLDRLRLWNLLRWSYQTRGMNPKRSILTGAPIASWEGRAAIISASLGRMQDVVAPKDCTSRFGRRPAARRLLGACASITEMVTRSTMTLATWSCYRVRSTRVWSVLARRCAITWKRSDHSQQSGTGVPRDVAGTAKTPLDRCGGARRSASSAAKGSSLRTPRGRPAPATAGINSVVRRVITTVFSCAKSAGLSFLRSSRTTRAESEPRAAERAEDDSGIRDVYNLSIDRAGCYYANGILVSNCDSFSQALNGARRYFLDAWATGGDNILDIRVDGYGGSDDDDEEERRYDF